MRVVAGAFKSRALRAPKGSSTRPTSDRVRESLFAVLGDVEGIRVLDLYAGSGALAIEALSRGAATAVCVESNRQAVAAIVENRDSLGLGQRLEIVTRKVSAAHVKGPFDLVLADPPWAIVAEAVADIEGHIDEVADGGLIVIEHAARDAAPRLTRAAFEETRVWGDTAASFFRVSRGDAS